MRIRTVKPEFFRHAELFDLEESSRLPVRLAFIGLWCAADRSGRFKWRPRELKIEILPHDQVDFSRVMDALATRGFIERYASQGTDYGFIPTFNVHQVINNRERDSNLPDPYDANTSTRAPRVMDACPTPLVQDQGEGKGREGKGKEQGKEGDSRFAPPSLSELQLECSKMGLPETEGQKFVAFYESKGWKVGKNPMKSWRSALSGWRIRWEETRNESKSLLSPNAAQGSASEKILWKAELDRVEKAIKTLRDNYEGHMDMSAEDRAKLKSLKDRKNELTKALGFQV